MQRKPQASAFDYAQAGYPRGPQLHAFQEHGLVSARSFGELLEACGVGRRVGQVCKRKRQCTVDE
jgi:hypothetical protein